MTTQPLEPGFMLIHGNRAEELCEIAIDWLVKNPLQPLEPEVILVQSSGVAQWLQQKIASAGIAAAIDFILPASFVWRAYKAVLAEQHIPEQALLDKSNLTWQLLRLLEHDFGPESAITNFLANADIRKKFQLAQHLASLYDQYQVYRADWLNQWQQGKNQIFDRQNQVQNLSSENTWQADLWRLILADTQAKYGHIWGRAQIHQEFLAQALKNDKQYPKLPRRIIVFGISTMPKQILESLVVLSNWVQVLVFINNPCEHYWGDIQGQHEILRSSLMRQQKKPNAPLILDDASLHNYAQPLLASWGRQGRDFITMLDDFDTLDRRQKSAQLFARINQKIDVFKQLPGANLLEQIQDDIRDLRPLEESKNWPVVNPEVDKSIEFHIVYSKQRELEVLHDQLLFAFDNDPELKPSDILVMVPNIASYAAHIEAVFGQYELADKRHLPFSVADQGQRCVDPLAIAIEKLLSLPDLRFGAKEIIDLLDVPALRSKFNIQASDLPLIRLWVEQANIRWGLNQKHKSSFIANHADDQNTWEFGLLRMLLGYASSDNGYAWHDIYPYAEPSGMQAEVLGYLANFLDKLNEYYINFSNNYEPEAWLPLINNLLDDCFLPETAQDQATVLRFKQVLQDWYEICNITDFKQALPLNIVAEYCLEQLDQSQNAPRFFAGAITFATLMPMRAIPFKYVCLLGMQDSDFPRNQTPADFDLMSLYPRSGDRSKREDDRYLFLEALLSAREKLYLSWQGLDINDSSEQPPSVLLAQLMDHIDAAWQSSIPGLSVSKSLSTYHPLQPFSKKYFWHDQNNNYFTYAYEWQQDSKQPINEITNVEFKADYDLLNLKEFVRKPIQYFYNHSLGIYFNNFMADLNEDEAYEINNLDNWLIKDSILKQIKQSTDNQNTIQEYKQKLVQQGYLPGGNMANFVLTDIANQIEPIINIYNDNKIKWHQLDEPISISTILSNGVQIQEQITDLYCDDDGNYRKLVLMASTAVEVKPRSAAVYSYKHMVSAWVEHIALNYLFKPTQTIIASPKGNVSFTPLDADTAKNIWDKLWLAFTVGITRPLAADPELSYQYLSRKKTDDFDDVYAELKNNFDDSLAQQLYIAHAFKDFEEFFYKGEFIKWSDMLYSDIRANLQSFKN